MSSTPAGVRRWFSAACAVALLGVVATGCAGGETGESATSAPGTATNTSGGSPAPSSSPAAGPEQFGPATLVSGQVSCRLIFGPVTTDDDGTMHGRDGKSMCTFTMNDPRVTGETTDTWLVDKWAGAQDRTLLIAYPGSPPPPVR